MYISTVMGAGYSVLTGIMLLIFAPQVIGVFTTNQKVVEYGVYIMRYFCPFYWMLGILHVLGGTIRGTGKTMQAMVVFLVSFVWIPCDMDRGNNGMDKKSRTCDDVLSDVLASGNATDAFVCKERKMDGSVRPGKIRLF